MNDSDHFCSVDIPTRVTATMDDNADQFCLGFFPTRDTALVEDLNDDNAYPPCYDDFWKQFDICTTARPIDWCAFEIPVVQERLQFCTIGLRWLHRAYHLNPGNPERVSALGGLDLTLLASGFPPCVSFVLYTPCPFALAAHILTHHWGNDASRD